MSRVRQYRLQQGDDLRTVAAREYGDPTRWTELARLNDLRIPFVVESFRAADRLPHTAIWGDTLLVPAEQNGARTPSPRSLFGADLALVRGQLTATPDGDLALVEGADNLSQAMSNRIRTMRGELTYHPRYGCHVGLAVGLPTMPFASLMAAAWVHEALSEEPRIARIRALDARVAGDIMQVAATVEAVGSNSAIDFNLVLNP